MADRRPAPDTDLMRAFNELVFSGFIKGSAEVFSDAQFQDLLGLADRLSIGGYTAQVTGTGPLLTVRIEQSFDKERWQARSSAPEIDAAALQTGTNETIVHGHDGGIASSRLAFVRLRITLGGTGTLAAQVRLWVAGRD